MKFDIFDDRWGEYIYIFMEERMDSFCEYRYENNDVSLAEYVDMFCKDEFKEYLIGYGFEFE